MAYFLLNQGYFLILFFICKAAAYNSQNTFVVNTWSQVFTYATAEAHKVLLQNNSALDAIESGCSVCEQLQCDTSVGFGNHPDTQAFTSLDAMIMNGDNMEVGSVGYIRKFRSAISIARLVMNYTTHSMIVGKGAEDFASMMGYSQNSSTTESTILEFEDWKIDKCQPNYYKNIPEAKYKCGPYYSDEKEIEIIKENKEFIKENKQGFARFGSDNHDTIGMIAKDAFGSLACGTSTNGANHKVAGRLGDSPIVGAGCYVDTNVGGATATGDGDIMMRFLPSFYAVMLMEQGLNPATACQKSIDRIAKYYPLFSGGLVCISSDGVHAGAANNMPFSYSYITGNMTNVEVVIVNNKIT